MAGYQPRNSGSNSNSSGNMAGRTQSSDRTSSSALFTTGLFTPDNPKSKAVGTVKVKEAITIPAGSYINLYESDKKGDKSPSFKLQVRESVKKV